jgi:hypothetical protein
MINAGVTIGEIKSANFLISKICKLILKINEKRKYSQTH